MSKIVLHIGFLKTASTTLQDQYFPFCDDVNFIHQGAVPEIRRFIQEVTNKNPAYFDSDNCAEILEGRMHDTKVNLISAENLSGQLLATVATPSLDFRYQILKNLSAVYPDAKVVLVIRKQDSMVNSIYREYLRQGGTESVDRFYGEGKKQRLAIISRDYFFYKSYVDAINQLFPAGVLILAFEEFVKNQSVFLQKLTDFLEISNESITLTKTNNTRLGEFGLECTRLLNKVCRSQLNPAGIFPGIPLRINGKFALRSPVKMLHNSWPGKGNISKDSGLMKIGNKIFEEAKKDNRALDETYSLGLKDYGYW